MARDALATGELAAGMVGDSTTNAVAGAQASQNAVENNALSDIIENKVSGVSQEEKYQNAQKQLVAMVEEFKAQNCAGLSAEACSAKISEHRNELLKGAAGFGVDFVPAVGDIKGFAEVQSAIDYLAAMVGLIPIAGDAAGKAIKAAEMALKKGDVAEASKLINKASDEIAGSVDHTGAAVNLDEVNRFKFDPPLARTSLQKVLPPPNCKILWAGNWNVLSLMPVVPILYFPADQKKGKLLTLCLQQKKVQRKKLRR
ncbi:VENN motif pre-toxin domain-containing protein [Pectobacterium punjabense]|uniref:VENN motif pre-toxin domain-containing protein n=1 Tax=Pectobacterium punjabense TaxID=2108399 RepID=UPI003802990D